MMMIPAAGPHTTLARLEAACRALAEAKTVAEVKRVRDQAEAIRLYVRQQRVSLTMQNDVAEIKLRAERRLGELLAADDPKGKRPRLHDGTLAAGATLPDGVSKTQSHRWQAIAALPEQEFEGHIAQTKRSGQELTTADMLRLAKRELRLRKKRSWLAANARAAKNSSPSWEIRQGDCLVRLAGQRELARLGFADPPYNIGMDYGDGAQADRLPDAEYLARCERRLRVCADCLTPDGSLWVLICHEYGADFERLLRGIGLYPRAWITWYETFGVNCSGNFNRTSRRLLYYVKDPRRFVFHAEAVNRLSDRLAKYGDKRADPDGKTWDDVWIIPRLTGTCAERVPDFPTQLPLDLLRPIIGCATDPRDLVVDPFCGSATTGVAAAEAGRRFIGIEKSERFAELARQRLAGQVEAAAPR